VIAAQARSAAKDESLLGSEDVFDLLGWNEKQLTRDEASSNLEEIRLVNAREEANALDDTSPASG
jgi:hypothetical protein